MRTHAQILISVLVGAALLSGPHTRLLCAAKSDWKAAPAALSQRAQFPRATAQPADGLTSTVNVPGTASFRSYGYGGLFCGPGGAPVDAGLNLSGLDSCTVQVAATGVVLAAGEASHNPDGTIVGGTFRAPGGRTYGPGSCAPGSCAAAGLPVPSGCFGSLIALFVDEKLRPIGGPFQAGSFCEVLIPEGATRLLFAINDDGYCDNGGSFQVETSLSAAALRQAPMGMLRQSEGQVTINGRTATSGTPPAFAGDNLVTGQSGSSLLDLLSGYQFRALPGTEFSLGSSTSPGCELKYNAKIKKGGGLFKRLRDLLHPPSKFEIKTPITVIGVRGTAFALIVDELTQSTTVTVFDDTVDLRSATSGELLATLWARGDGRCQQAVVDAEGHLSGPFWVDCDSSSYSFPPYQAIPLDTLAPQIVSLTDVTLPGGVVRISGRVQDNCAPPYRIAVSARPGTQENLAEPIVVTGPDDSGLFSVEATPVDGSNPASVLLGISDPANNVLWREVDVVLRTYHAVYVDSANTSGVEDGTQAHPFNTIQEGIDAAGDRDTVKVAAGTYRERIGLPWDIHLTLVGAGPALTKVWPSTYEGAALLIREHATAQVQAMSFQGARKGIELAHAAHVVLEDFLIEHCERGVVTSGYDAAITARRGRISHCVIGIDGSDHLPLRLTNILFERIGLDHAEEAGVIADGTVEIVNCTFAEHYSEDSSVPAVKILYGPVTIRNTIIWNCGKAVEGKAEHCQVDYSCFGRLQGSPGPYYRDTSQGGTNLPYGTDPMFVAPYYPHYDYHLLPTSPCVDAGDPAEDYSLEPEPNGGRIDMGAYGNTPEATPNRLGAILALPDTSAAPGSTLIIPITVSTDSAIALAQFVLEFDSTVIAFQQAQVGPGAPGFSISLVNRNLPFSPEPGMNPRNKNVLVQISGGGGASFTGQGKIVVLLHFLVTGPPGWGCSLRFDTRPSHCFLTTCNLTDIQSGQIRFLHGYVSVPMHFSISGYARYCPTGGPVSQAEVVLDNQSVSVTGGDGRYQLSSVLTGTHTLALRKSGDHGGAISGADALAVLRHLAFLPPALGACQLRAADVTLDKAVTGADALALLHYLAFFPTNIGHTGTWAFVPAETTFTLLANASLDFVATLLGDVNGNWTPGQGIPLALLNTVEGAAPQPKAILVAPAVGSTPGELVTVPVSLSTDSLVALAQFVLEYDSTVVTCDTVLVGADAGGFSLLINRRLPFPPSCPGTNKNLLLQLRSSDPASGITGPNRQIAVLRFLGVGAFASVTPLAFDPRPERTFLTTPGLVDLCGTDLEFVNGQISLPVELLSFSAEVDRGEVHLSWVTEPEASLLGFEVHRSIDGLHFASVGFVPAHRSDAPSHVYRFTDTPAVSGTYYYRLAQKDADGSLTCSGWLEVVVSPPRESRLLQNHPNPFNAQTEVRFQLAQPCHVVLTVWNVQGQQIRKLLEEERAAGYHTIHWDGKNEGGLAVASGVYLLRMKAGTVTETRRLLLMRGHDACWAARMGACRPVVQP
ncbi:MAG: T9SS type A sorting domain-containing protein, partial [Calditrichaeota bacterium]|nr:T9SS type A sorting domain-containing protein [Calditrichota bacterium]